jgi:membrane protease subunit HflK
MNEKHTTEPTAGTAALTEALNASFRLFRWTMVGLVAAYLCSGLFIVKQHEQAFVLRFGQITGLGQDRIKGPGFHWTLPRPFSEIVRVPVERVQTLSTRSFWQGAAPEFQDETASQPGPTLRPGRDGYTLTGDANLLHSRWSVRYTIEDAETWAFGLADGEAALRADLDQAVVAATARFSIDRALRTELEALRGEVESNLRRLVEAHGLAVRIQGVDLLAIIPPPQVAEAFDEVIRAEQERGGTISGARAYAARTANEARGEAARILTEGETFKRRLIDEISADATYFEQVYAKYVRNPDVVRQTLLQDTVRRTLRNVEQKYVVHAGNNGLPPQIRLQLGPETRRLGKEESEE